MSTICLIGHPNCGKSTIFNKLTKSRQHTGNRDGVTVEVKKGKHGNKTIYDIPGLTSYISQNSTDDRKIAQEFISQNKCDLILNVVDITNIREEINLTLELIKLNRPLILVLNKADRKAKEGIDVDVKKLSQVLNIPIVETIADRGFGIENIKNLIKNHNHEGCIQNPSYGDMLSCIKEVQVSTSGFFEKVDKYVLHKTFGPIIFLSIMFGVFALSINIGDAIGIRLQSLSDLFFSSHLKALTPQYLRPILIDGIGGAITLTVQFIPIIAILYFLIGVLEESGYMPRAACVMDRIMKKVGLSGKSFIPLIIGFGCNVPAILTIRTLECKSEKIATAMMVPFMSCGARLSVYTILGTVFFKSYTTLVVFCLYLLGMIVAIFSGYLIKKFIAKPQGMCFLINIPKYQLPRLNNLLSNSYSHAKEFAFRAGKLITIVFVIVAIIQSSFKEDNYIEKVSKGAVPLFEPIGITYENWPAATGLLTGIIAKEMVIASIISNNKSVTASTNSNFGFSSTYALLAYLVFILLYFPCISTFAVMTKELSYKWAFVSVTWSMATAYLAAFFIYQIGLMIA